MLDIIHSFLQNLTTEENDPQEDRILASSVDLNIEVTLRVLILRFGYKETLNGTRLIPGDRSEVLNWFVFYLCVILPSNPECILLILQDFKVLTLLGKGSFACVYKAKSVNTGLEVAIKMVRTCCVSIFCITSE